LFAPEKMNRPVLIYHSDIPANAPPDELDVLDQVAWFEIGLKLLKYNALIHPFTLSIDTIEKQLYEIRPEFIVNLVETVRGCGRLIHMAPALFEHFSVPFTGCSSESVYLTSNKIIAKKIMRYSGIATPDWIEYGRCNTKQYSGDFLIKSIWEHASAGIDEHNFSLLNNPEAVCSELKRINGAKEPSFFAERYIEGREFNISMAGSGSNPKVLPPAEMRFIDYPPNKHRIVGYRAKWDTSSFEYSNTVRSFDHSDTDKALIDSIKDVSFKVWHLFRLNGYARVDFRVDQDGIPWVLEVNANPCISGNSGFVAAAEIEGIQHHELAGDLISNLS